MASTLPDDWIDVCIVEKELYGILSSTTDQAEVIDGERYMGGWRRACTYRQPMLHSTVHEPWRWRERGRRRGRGRRGRKTSDEDLDDTADRKLKRGLCYGRERVRGQGRDRRLRNECDDDKEEMVGHSYSS